MLDEMLDVLPVTDMAYHALHHTQPLTAALLRRVRQLRRDGGRVLLVAPNELLTLAVRRLGYDVGVWHVTTDSMSDELCRMASRSGSLDELLAASLGPARWDLIVLPYVMEAAQAHPVEQLQRLREALAPGGRLVVAYRRVGSLENRIAGVRGKNTLPDPYLHRRRVSLSWPNLEPRRRIGSAELRAWCAMAGFRLEEETFERDSHATVPIDVMSTRHWLGAQVRSAAKRVAPSLRDVGVATLSPHPGEPRYASPPSLVSIAVFGSTPEASDHILRALAQQSYPRELLDVLLVHNGDPGFGQLTKAPRGFSVRSIKFSREENRSDAANTALREARGSVIGFADDACALPRGWVDTGAYAVSGWTAAVRGRAADPNDIDPLVNTFYLRSALLEVGGWHGGADSRLRALGYEVKFEETLYVSRPLKPVMVTAPGGVDRRLEARRPVL